MANPIKSARITHYKSYQDQKNAESKLWQSIIIILSFFLLYQITTTFFIKSYYNPNYGMEPTVLKGNRVLASPFSYGPILWGGKRLGSTHLPQRGEMVLVQSPGGYPMPQFNQFVNPFLSFISLQFLQLKGEKNRLHLPELLIKRVIGLPGDTLKMENSVIFVKPRDQLYFISEFEFAQKSYGIKRQAIESLLANHSNFNNNFTEITLNDNEFFVIGDNRSLMNDSRSFGFVTARDIRAKVIGHY